MGGGNMGGGIYINDGGIHINGDLSSDWSIIVSSPPYRGRNYNDGTEHSRSSMGDVYPQPVVDSQEHLLPDQGNDEHGNLDESQPTVFVYSRENQIISNDNLSRRRLGFFDKTERTPRGINPSTIVKENEGTTKMADGVLPKTSSSSAGNSVFLSIGGRELYIQEIVHPESDEDDEEDSSDDESIESSESEDDSTGSSDTDGSSDSFGGTMETLGAITLQDASSHGEASIRYKARIL